MEMECLPRFAYGAEARQLERRRARRSDRPRRRRHRAAPDQRHGALDRGRRRPRHAAAARGRDRLLRGHLGRQRPRRAAQRARRRWSGSTRPKSSGASGCATATSPTTPGASTCSARRWSSRGSPTRRPARSLAAPTTSLPETPGGERNWDYRYSWIRDSTFSLWALHTLGFDQEARDFMRFIVGVCREDPELQIMYGIGGEKELTESTLDHLERLRRRAAGADRQRRLRPAPERRLGRAARLDLPARKGAARHAARRPTAS